MYSPNTFLELLKALLSLVDFAAKFVFFSKILTTFSLFVKKTTQSTTASSCLSSFAGTSVHVTRTSDAIFT